MNAEDPRQYLNDMEEGFRVAMEGQLVNTWTAMPCIVQTVDLAKMTLSCVIAIQTSLQDSSGAINMVNIAPILDVPIVFPSAGGFTITMPIAPGDEVLVMFASRCIDAWWQNGGILNPPMDYRMHDLSDGFAIPGPRSQPRVVPNISTTNLQIRTDAGTSYIELTPGGAINLVGNVTVTGTLQATEEITAMTSGTAIPLSTHIHGGVTPGSGDTTGPLP